MVRKTPGSKTNVPDKRRRTMITKRRYKVKVLIQATPSTPTSTTPAPTVATVSTQTPIARSTAESIPVMVYKLATGQFTEVPCLTTRPQNEGSNPPPLEDMPSAPPRQSTPWSNSGSTSENLFETRRLANSPYPSSYTCSCYQNRRTTPSCSNPPCHGNAQAGYREMLMGTTLPHLQKEERTQRRLGGQYAEPTKNAPTKYSMPSATDPSVPPTPEQSVP